MADPQANSSDSPSPAKVLRILDANANRAAEGLRVVEDFCRFLLDDAHLTSLTKSLRHALAQTLADSKLALAVRARDAQGDVGAELTNDTEQTRHDAHHVATASLKRAEQALRCLEEYSKVLSKELGGQFERIRYRTYDLEMILASHLDSCSRLTNCQIYVLVEGISGDASDVAKDTWERQVQSIVDGGADVVQLRDKRLNDRDILRTAKRVREMTRGHCLFIMNDRADLALASHADGVHIGQEEMPLREARRLMGPDRLVGVSTHSIEQVEAAIEGGASYLGCGPTFPSTTKSFTAFPGLDFLRQVVSRTQLPFFAIGGIDTENVGQLWKAGVKRIAVGSAVWNASDQANAIQSLKQDAAD